MLPAGAPLSRNDSDSDLVSLADRTADTKEGHAGAGAGLGDIMGSAPLTDLTRFSPLQRVALTANGNLQRVVSAYHNAPVTVALRQNNAHSSVSGTYERDVELLISGIPFARCWSTVKVTRDDLMHAIEVDGVAIGQLFRHFGVLPRFELHAMGKLGSGMPPTNSEPRSKRAKHDSGSPTNEDFPTPSDAFADAPRFWRQYTLEGNGVTCQIREEIRSDTFELRIDTKPSRPEHATPSLGDIMAPSATFSKLPDGFTPRQRLLLSANGNVERILSSYYAR